MPIKIKFVYIIIFILIIIISFILPGKILNENTPEDVIMSVGLTFNYYFDNDRQLRIPNIRTKSINILYLKEYTKIRFEFEIVDRLEGKSQEFCFSKETISKDGFIRLYYDTYNSEYFKKGTVYYAEVTQTPSDSVLDETNYKELNSNIDKCNECYFFGNLEKDISNDFYIILKFQSIFTNDSSSYLRYLMPKYRRIIIRLNNVPFEKMYKEEEYYYNVELVLPDNININSYSFPKINPPRSGIKDIQTFQIEKMESADFYGDLKFSNYDFNLFINYVALFLAIFAISIEILIKAFKLSQEDTKILSKIILKLKIILEFITKKSLKIKEYLGHKAFKNKKRFYLLNFLKTNE